ncbi:MAG: fibronectin type III domain-containing protein [Candidatus Glassbacteria bacterium]|nr:fibronectin type III domain-containing protein [Candidatus Glassbacteria bacterium]
MKTVSLAAIILLLTGVGNLQPETGGEAQVLMRGLEVSDISVSSAIVSWVTDQKCSYNRVEVRPAAKDSVITFQDKYRIATYVHYVELTGLEPDSEYLYRIGSDTGTWDNQGEWYSFHTLQAQPQTMPRAIVCQVLDTYSEPLERVLVRIRAVKEGSEPSALRTVLTAKTGWWDTTYSTLLTTGGELYNAGRDDLLTVEYLVNYWSSYTDENLVLSGESSQNLDQVSIPVYDPGRGTKGDLTGDEAINIFDLLEMLKILSEQIPQPLDQRLAFAADLDSNGSVTIMDLLALLQMLSSAA